MPEEFLQYISAQRRYSPRTCAVYREAIERALSEAEESEDCATDVAKKYLRGKERSKETILKAYKYLISRGYSYDTAKAAAERLQEDED